MHSERLLQLKQEHLRQIKNVGAPDHAGIRSETRAETNRAFPTNQFRQRRGKVWEPQVVLEPDAVQERIRKTVDFMILHAPFQRDQVILLLVRQTGARISEIIEMTAGGYRAARHAGRALVKHKGSRGREEKTIYFTSSLERHLLSYIRTERATYDPQGRKRLEELDDGDPLFLTRTGKPYTRAAFYHHWNKLFPPAQRPSSKQDKQEHVEFTPHDLRHLRATRAITTVRKEASGDPAAEAALLEGFQHLMGWRSPETMSTYVKTMNKRQALQGLLADEEAQEQCMTHVPTPSQPQQRSFRLTPGQERAFPKVSAYASSDPGELDWYEE
jgi:integrase